MLEKLKTFFSLLNSKGIPIPLIRDPKTTVGSISLTLLVISALNVQAGIIQRLLKTTDGIDLLQATNWFLICAGLYFGRNLSTKSVTANLNDKDNTDVK